MPTSKHRRKGKLRPRGKVNNAIPPRPIVDPEDPWRQDAVLVGQLQKMFGGNDWTDAQIDAALDEIDRETDAMEQRIMARLRPAPEPPQQLELFPGNSLAETSR
jgi:hypothetical protein